VEEKKSEKEVNSGDGSKKPFEKIAPKLIKPQPKQSKPTPKTEAPPQKKNIIDEEIFVEATQNQ
jgi:hypothetical protein